MTRRPGEGVAELIAAPVTAWAKVNLCLFLGPPRADGRHELVTLFESVTLTDELVFAPSSSLRDEVLCAGVTGPNLVAEALAGLRAAGWSASPIRVQIDKRIPVAAGMGGGSADAAAVLRHASRLAPVAAATLRQIARGLGADVPSQLDPGVALGTGAGDAVVPTAELAAHALLVLPQRFGLSTAEVYREADRLGLGRPEAELARCRAELESRLGTAGLRLGAALLVNDLEPAALSLRPEIGAALEAALATGAEHALVCGSGPTVIAVFWGPDGYPRAAVAAAQLRERFPGAAATRPVSREIAAVAGFGHNSDLPS